MPCICGGNTFIGFQDVTEEVVKGQFFISQRCVVGCKRAKRPVSLCEVRKRV